METIGKAHKPTKAEQVLDGHDLNQDIHQLLGYVWQHGKNAQSEIFPSEHLCELGNEFMRKHRPLEGRSPKGMLNNVHHMKRLLESFKNVNMRADVLSEKLSIHEHYMKIIQEGRSFNRSDMCASEGGQYHADVVEGIANNMEKEANEALQKPESFDDIEEDWTARGNGTSAIQS